ncbi:hypothetical protein JHK82_016321 [Glycine max]|nr:hypothetical protein JHK82_016321 [Glycine max]
MHYLYIVLASSDLPHQYLKSNNVLVGPDNEPMLVDYRVSRSCAVYYLGVVIIEILIARFRSHELELKPQGTLRAIVIKANDLKNMEMIGKSDPYAVLYIRPLFKVKTKVIDNNLNPVWNEVFDLIAEDKETQSLIVEVLHN